MSRTLWAAGWLAFGSLCLSPESAEATEATGPDLACDQSLGDPDELAALAGTFGAWAEFVRLGDVAGLANLVTEDARFWTHGRPELRGREALREAWEVVFENYRIEQSFECREVIQTGEWAIARGIEHNRVVPLAGGEAVEQEQRAFSVLFRGSDGNWRFARGMTNLARPPIARSSDE